MIIFFRRNKWMVLMLAFIGMFCWGITPVFVKMGLKDVNPLVGLSIRAMVTMLVLLIWMLFNGSMPKIASVPKTAFLILGAEAFLATVVGDLAYFAAIKKGEVSLVALIMASSPLVTLLFSVTFLGEQITLQRMIGTILIIAGIIFAV